MPHADSSYFATGLSKDEVYTQMIEQARGLIYGQKNWVRITHTTSTRWMVLRKDSNLSNTASLLWHAYAVLPANINWAGFYIRDDKFPPSSSQNTSSDRVLLLGPFQGKPACQLIHFGRGVCGTAAAKKETVVVDDVMAFPGHIACDAESRSEVVVPVLVGGETVAIIDIDCTEEKGFDEVDRKYLEELAGVLAEGCDW